jgi:hypothetical protein
MKEPDMEFIIANLLGIAVGVALKILVPMPFLDDKVRAAYAWVARKIAG